jgi:ABC-type nitrate/sulfonate/bicarbonate transport system substrate-binding protein
MRTVLAKGLLSAIVALVVVSPIPRSFGAESKPVRLAFSGFGIGTVITWIASEKKLFETYGLHVEDLYLEGPDAAGVQALLGVDFFISSGNAVAPVAAMASGADVVVLAAHTSKENYLFGVAPDIANIRQLKGKRIGVSGVGRKSDLIARVVLRRAGLDPIKDVEVLPIGLSPQRAAAVYQNYVQGAPLIPAVAKEARRIGLKIIDIGEVRLVTDLFMTTRSRVKKDPEVINKLLQGYLSAIQFFLANREESMRIMGEHVTLTDGTSLPGVYQNFAAQLDPVPLAGSEAIQALIDAVSVSNESAKKLTERDLFEPSFLEKLKSSGFVKRLYSEKVSL